MVSHRNVLFAFLRMCKCRKCHVAKFNIALAPGGVKAINKSLKDRKECRLQTMTTVIILLYLTEERTIQAKAIWLNKSTTEFLVLAFLLFTSLSFRAVVGLFWGDLYPKSSARTQPPRTLKSKWTALWGRTQTTVATPGQVYFWAHSLQIPPLIEAVAHRGEYIDVRDILLCLYVQLLHLLTVCCSLWHNNILSCQNSRMNTRTHVHTHTPTHTHTQTQKSIQYSCQMSWGPRISGVSAATVSVFLCYSALCREMRGR